MGHSLNLTREKASNASMFSTIYFMFLQAIYVFFLASDICWALLKEILESNKIGKVKVRMLQRVECTRWGAGGTWLQTNTRKIIKYI